MSRLFRYQPCVILLAVLLAAVNLLARLALADDPAPIRIGSILILTGEGAATGNASKNGIEMAKDEINAGGGLLGRRLQVIFQDDQGDPKKSIAAFRQLTDSEGISLIIGPTWSNVGLPLIDLAAQKHTLMISPSLGVATFNESSEYLFNTWPHDDVLSRKLAQHVYAKGHRHVALVGAEQVWVKEQTEAFKKEFEQLGGKIVFLTEPLPGSTDLRSEALKIKNLKSVDALVSTTDGIIVGSLLAKALRDLRVTLPTYSITLDQTAIDAAQGGFEGMEFLTFLTPEPEFKRRYEARYKTTIDLGADSAYDAVMMLARAIRTTRSTDATILAKELATIRQYRGASGDLVSDGKRGFNKPFALKRISGGVPQP